MFWKPRQPKQAHSLNVYQATLDYYVWNRFFDGFKNTFMSVCGNTFNMNSQFNEVIQIFLYLTIMFAIGESNQLGIPIIMILIAQHTELFKVSCIHSQMNTASLQNFNYRRSL